MTGKKGENRAALYLRLHGYSILHRNFHSRFGEIDIVAKRGDTIAFVEVKARGDNAISSPAAAVDIYKQKKLIKTAQYYLLCKNIDDCNLRFDVIEVSKCKTRLKLNHIKDAFQC